MRHHQFASAAGEVFPESFSCCFSVPVLNFHPPNLSSAFATQQTMLANGYVNFASQCVKSNAAQIQSNLRVEKQKMYYTAVCIVVA